MSDEFFNNSGRKLYGVKIIPSVQIKENNKEKLTIYPNPTKGKINIKATSPIQKIRIFNLEGQLLFTGQSLKSIEHLENGQYIIEIDTEDIYRQVIVKF